MILPRYRIGPSTIPGAGKGVFLEQALPRGRIAVAPDRIDQTWSFAEILSDPERAKLLHTSVRWFEDRYTLSGGGGASNPPACGCWASSSPRAIWMPARN